MDEYKIKVTPDLYTIAINSCSQTGDWEFALSVYNDMKKKGVVPDEIFLSALIDVAGHAGRVDAAFDILEEARTCGMHLGIVSYSSLMGACCEGDQLPKAMEIFYDMKRLGCSTNARAAPSTVREESKHQSRGTSFVGSGGNSHFTNAGTNVGVAMSMKREVSEC